MSAEAVACDIREPELLTELRPAWDASMQEFPASGVPSFLTPEELAHNREWCGLDAAADAELQAAAGRIRANPALCRLAWHYAWRIFDSPAFNIERWPALQHSFNGNLELFALLIALSIAPRLRRYHRMLGVPESVTRETCLETGCFAGNYQRARSGRLGIFTRQIGWLRTYTWEHLFRIGRLEFWAKPFTGNFTVFHHKTERRVIALAANGACFNAEGFMDAPAKNAAPPAWTARFRLEEQCARGFPITPWGKALPHEVKLPFADWDCALHKDDTVLDIHIPAGGNMGPDICIDALRRARDFFKRCFPHRVPRAFVCASWIFSPLLEEALPQNANLVRFLSETHLVPVPQTGPASLWFIFFQNKFDPASAPRETSIQRAMLDYLAGGRMWRDGGMFLMLDDLEHFGTQFYRRTWRKP